MKIIYVVGARPQFIKLSILSRELKKFHNEIIVHTGQHFDKEMSESFFYDLDITKPHYNLGIDSGLHGRQTGYMLIELEKVIVKTKPDLIIVFGDTNSTLAGVLVGAKLFIPIVHIEAGLRSFNKQMPEEINRILSDHAAEYLFAPTQTAMLNLKNENLGSKSYLTGDIMTESLNYAITKGSNKHIIEQLKVNVNDYYLVTLHRPYNVDEPENLQKILNELGELSKKVLFPIHPRTKKIIEHNKLFFNKNIILIKPVGYLNFIKLLSKSYKIITDSGGIQKEAYILKKPCVTLRSETEWVETVESGWNLLINPKTQDNYFKKIEKFTVPTNYKQLFGNNVSKKMVEIINKIDSVKTN